MPYQQNEKSKQLSHVEFLQELDITHEEYILALHITLKKQKLFLKGNVKDRMHTVV